MRATFRLRLGSLRSYNFRMLFDSLAIVGVGLIGGSVGLAAKARAATRHVVGIGRNPDTLATGQVLGAIDEFTTDLAAGVAAADIVVFCSPVDLDRPPGRATQPHAQGRGSVHRRRQHQGDIVRDLERSLPGNVRFVGAHPLAGSEKQGAEYAGADLFEGRVCVLTPTAKTDSRRRARLAVLAGARLRDQATDAGGARSGAGDDEPSAAPRRRRCWRNRCPRAGGRSRRPASATRRESRPATRRCGPPIFAQNRARPARTALDQFAERLRRVAQGAVKQDDRRR